MITRYDASSNGNPLGLTLNLTCLLRVFILVGFILSTCLLSNSCSINHGSKKKLPVAVDGVMDLSDWDFYKDGTIKLDGKWEFYWDKLLDPARFSVSPYPVKTGWIRVPSVWKTYTVNNALLPFDGYATYRLIIHLPPSSETKALSVVLISTAYTLWVDGKKILSNGKVGTQKASMVPQWLPGSASFIHSGNIMEVVVQVSNFEHRRGGIRHSIVMGTELQIRRDREKSLFWEHMSFGCLFIMGLYHLGLFIFRRKDLSFLYFSIFCLTIVIRLSTTGNHLLNIYTKSSWAWTMRLEYLSFYAALPLINLFLRSLYPREHSRRMVRLSVFFGGICSVVVLFTPALIYTKTLSAYQAVTLLYSLYFFLVLGRAVYRKREGSAIFLLGFLVLIIATVNDILYSRMIIFTGSYGHLGFLFFLFSQASLLLVRYSQAFSTMGKLSKQLEEMVENLEETVDNRTRELKSAYDTIKQISIKDPLTDCYNRRYLDEQLQREATQAHRYKQTFSIILCDIDYFKKINDTHGHLAGDQVLVEFASILKSEAREATDWVCRYGGEEFLIILPHIQTDQAASMANRIRKKLEKTLFGLPGESIRLSASFGVSAFLPGENNIAQGIDEMLKLADKRLYMAKHKGRNQVISPG